jgi:DMSO/TMAO reductase YedYZ molybdopterin-dependent catalytic subunit
VIPAQAGGPVRFVSPPGYWGYKHVKWAARADIVDRFCPGFWETKVGDPVGRIPEGVEIG